MNSEPKLEGDYIGIVMSTCAEWDGLGLCGYASFWGTQEPCFATQAREITRDKSTNKASSSAIVLLIIYDSR